MPKTVVMIVSLKVPDTTAFSAMQTLKNIGFDKIKDVKRDDYYKFSIEGDDGKFKGKINKVDILVNANKHLCTFSLKKDESVKILVKNINGNQSEILLTLKNRLGLNEIKNVEKAVLWSLAIDAEKTQARKIADKAARELLVNENYQEYLIL